MYYNGYSDGSSSCSWQSWSAEEDIKPSAWRRKLFLKRSVCFPKTFYSLNAVIGVFLPGVTSSFITVFRLFHKSWIKTASFLLILSSPALATPSGIFGLQKYSGFQPLSFQRSSKSTIASTHLHYIQLYRNSIRHQKSNPVFLFCSSPFVPPLPLVPLVILNKVHVVQNSALTGSKGPAHQLAFQSWMRQRWALRHCCTHGTAHGDPSERFLRHCGQSNNGTATFGRGLEKAVGSPDH